ncbi:MAG: A/G-specific adenine glycosylase, partial [Flavobacteriales bacterium]
AARQVVEEHQGRFPADHAALMRLKGVGDYTASAIASICFGIPEPVVDGNVYRVLARVFGIDTPIDGTEGKKRFRALAAELLDQQWPGDHNQAVMELGAMVCTPRNPRCDACPLARKCIARAEGRTAELPVKAKRAAARVRHFNYLWIETEHGILFRQRGPGDIWQGLWELPLVETGRPAVAAALRKEAGLAAVKKLEGPVKHVLSHQRISATLWQAEWNGAPLPKDWKPVRPRAVEKLPMHRLMERLLDGKVRPGD